MAALPPPPSTNGWSDAITSAVEDLIVRVEVLEHTNSILVEEASLRKTIREAEERIHMLNDAMLITPATKSGNKRIKR